MKTVEAKTELNLYKKEIKIKVTRRKFYDREKTI